MSTMVATDNTFEQSVIAASHTKAVLVDFGAEWCPPCKMLDPLVEQIADEYADSLTVIKIDTDENQWLVRQYSIMANPTLILFKDGEPVKRVVGYQSKTRLLAQFEAFL